jgi:PTS system cellobiose-specific IIC component
MNKLIDSLQKALMPLANKISTIKFLSALGATFQILLPIIMIGSFSCLGAFLNARQTVILVR